jgi:Mrp family chromosome partitioning ATPase
MHISSPYRDHLVVQNEAIREHLDRIGRKILIMSGSPDAGKTTVTVHLGAALVRLGCRVGVLDGNLKKSDVAKQCKIAQSEYLKVPPNLVLAGINTVSTQAPDQPFSMIEQLLAQTEWGDLDFLLIDSPAKVTDEHLAICEIIPELTGVIIVTSAQERSILDVVRSVTFCRKMQIAVLGIVENMSMPEKHDTETGAWKAHKVGAPFLGSLAMHTTDKGSVSFHETLAALALMLQKQVACSQGENLHV